jgi:putative protein-disulfide isomerase
MNRALTAFHEISPAAEAGLLRALQHARYVLGRDTAQSDVVEEIGIAWARENNVDSTLMTLPAGLMPITRFAA